MAAEYLLKKECRELAFLCADSSRYGMLAKGEAFYNAVEMAGIKCHKLIGCSSSNVSPLFTLEEERDAVNMLIEQFLKLQPVPDGIFVPNDFITVLVYQALRKRGVIPGKEVIIVSCDNEPILNTLEPRPASIDTRGEELGRRAVQQLCWRMEHFYDPNQVTIGILPRIID
jgi:LacI family transcriptional regulator